MPRSADIRTIQDSVSTIVRVQRSRRARHHLEDRAGVALAPTAIEVLGAIHRLGPVRHGPVAVNVGIQPSRVSKEARVLVSAGLVTETPDPEDRRAVVLQTTPAGAAALARYRDAAQAALSEVLSDWSDDDVTSFAEMINRLAEAFRRTTPAPQRQQVL